MKKILLINNSTILYERHGGYSKQMYYLCKMLKDFNYEIYNLMFTMVIRNDTDITQLYSYYELKSIINNSYENINIFDDDFLKEIKYLSHQSNVTELSVDDINRIIEKYNIDYVFFLGDIFVFYKNIDKKFIIPSFAWFTCHYYPFASYDYLGLKLFSNIICLSPSIKLILEKDFPNKKISYLPHVAEKIDINLSKDEIRDKWNLPKNKFIVLIVAQLNELENRKAIDTNIIAFKQFSQKYKNSLLYIHSSSTIIKHSYCFPIEELICKLEISNEEIIINKKKFTEEKMAELYKLSDIYLCNSKAEGFGVPIIEAQLYNTNVITGNFLSMNEHNFQKNITEKSTELINYDLNGIWILPSTVSIFNKIEEVYLNNNEEKIKKANWIISNLTSFNNIKKNLYKILMDT